MSSLSSFAGDSEAWWVVARAEIPVWGGLPLTGQATAWMAREIWGNRAVAVTLLIGIKYLNTFNHHAYCPFLFLDSAISFLWLFLDFYIPILKCHKTKCGSVQARVTMWHYKVPGSRGSHASSQCRAQSCFSIMSSVTLYSSHIVH